MPFNHSVVSLHTRLPYRVGEQASPEPPTHWLTLTMPWKQWLYDVATDEVKYKHPRWSFGFRFWRY
jgi:hypothetical protein